MMADDIEGPNGLAFSPDESILYVVASRAEPNRLIRAFDVVDGGKKLTNNRVFIDAEGGTPDGFRVDIHGNLWCGWGMGDAELDGVRVFDADGKTDRSHRAAGACRQSVLRWPLPEPAVHGGQPRTVCALREHPGRRRRLIAPTGSPRACDNRAVNRPGGGAAGQQDGSPQRG